MRDLRDNWAPLLSLTVVAVGLTTAAVAVVAHALVPGLPWAAAVALGAVVAPPDAVAATAVLRPLRPPQRILGILEGESLLNDATALLIYRLAVGAVAAGGFTVQEVAPTFLLGVLGSLVAGPAMGWLVERMLERVQHIPTAIILQFVSTFTVWLLAEHIGLSGVLTTVCFAMTLGRLAPARVPGRIRIPTNAVWATVVFALNIFAFIFIGLQIRPILVELAPQARDQYLLVAVAVLATVIVVRVAWHMSFNAAVRWRNERHGFHPPRPMLRPTVGSGLVISWAGMRGIVTLAAALALPPAFPMRDLIVLTAFLVVLGTLLIQGLTLKPLLRALDLRDGDPVAREEEAARRHLLDTARSRVPEGSPAAEAVRKALKIRLGRLQHADGPHAAFAADYEVSYRAAVQAARRRCCRCAIGARSATTPSTRWRTNWIGWRCPIRCAPPMRTPRSSTASEDVLESHHAEPGLTHHTARIASRLDVVDGGEEGPPKQCHAGVRAAEVLEGAVRHLALAVAGELVLRVHLRRRGQRVPLVQLVDEGLELLPAAGALGVVDVLRQGHEVGVEGGGQRVGHGHDPEGKRQRSLHRHAQPDPARHEELHLALVAGPTGDRLQAPACRFDPQRRHRAEAVLVEVGLEVQHGHVDRVDHVLQHLEVVARPSAEGVDAQPVLPGEHIPVRQLGRIARAHVGPDKAVSLHHRVGLDADALREVSPRRFPRLLTALAGAVVQPAVVRAAHAVVVHAAAGLEVLVAGRQRGAPVGAPVVHEPELAAAVAEQRESLAEHLDGHRIAPGELFRHRDGQPVASEHPSGRRAGHGVGEQSVLVRGQHG
ncbi:sodium:proton antiporter [Aquabacterium sp. J223]|nr:sodium:proton antiporter [Aquabacterium sp. J223]UUX95236.1 sodium:proton antiporter [Aquabacterium sp. J223]